MTLSQHRQPNDPHRWSATDDTFFLFDGLRPRPIASSQDNRNQPMRSVTDSCNLETVVHPDRAAASTPPHRHRFLTIPITSTDRLPTPHSAAVSFM
jgi:hypothetical protein